MGRPTKLTDELREKADSYLSYCYAEDEIPSSVGLALFLDVSKSTIYKWADEDDSFSDTLSKIQGTQERLLFHNGLNGKYNSTITKLMLSNHGYSDTSKVDHTTKGKELPTPILGGTSAISREQSTDT